MLDLKLPKRTTPEKRTFLMYLMVEGSDVSTVDQSSDLQPRSSRHWISASVKGLYSIPVSTLHDNDKYSYFFRIFAY